MKIKAKKPFVSGVFSAAVGEVLELPERRAAKLISLGFASPVKGKPRKALDQAQAAVDTPASGKSEEVDDPGDEAARRAAEAVSDGEAPEG